jgi:hypothetical protein
MPIRLPKEQLERYLDAALVTFLEKNHQEVTIKGMLDVAINKTIADTRVFPDNFPADERAAFCKTWGNVLFSFVEKYTEPQTEEEFENDFIQLYSLLAEDLPVVMLQDLGIQQPGFRLIAAQNSLALWLKQLWAKSVIPAPPACPLTDDLLHLATADVFLQCWNHINDIKEYRDRIALLKEEAGELGIARWEALQQVSLEYLRETGKLGNTLPIN